VASAAHNADLHFITWPTAAPRPFSLACGGDHRVATSDRVGKGRKLRPFLGRPRCLIPSVRPEGIWPHNARIVLYPLLDRQSNNCQGT